MGTLVAKRPHTTLHGPQPSLAGLIARADLAIGAGGATTWERACLGLPTLMAPIAHNQFHVAKAMSKSTGIAIVNFEKSDEALIEEMKNLSNTNAIHKISLFNASLLQGHGTITISNMLIDLP